MCVCTYEYIYICMHKLINIYIYIYIKCTIYHIKTIHSTLVYTLQYVCMKLDWRGIRKATSENERGIREEYDQNM